MFFIWCVALVANFTVAQDKLAKVKIANPDEMGQQSSFYLDNLNSTMKDQVLSPVNGDTLGFTNYDYAGNNLILRQIDVWDIDGDNKYNPMMTAMMRQPGAARIPTFFVGDPSGYASLAPIFDTVVSTTYGWGNINYIKEGPNQGKVALMGHGGGASWFAEINLSTFTSTVKTASGFGGGNGPQFTYLSNGDYICGIGYGINQWYKSADGGATWTLFDSLSHYFQGTDYSSEYEWSRSPNGQRVATYGAVTYVGNGGLGGTPDDSADFTFVIHSTDGGTTWSKSKIALDGKVGQVSNRSTYGPLVENFGQVTGVVTNSAVHVVANGYGFWGNDSTFSYPVIYWNSTSQQWVALSLQAVEQDTSGGNIQANQRPGNGLGQAYANIAASEDGSVLFVTWQAAEYSGTPGASAINIYPGDGGSATAPIMYTDIWGTYSQDGGQTWSQAQKLFGKTNVGEVYPVVADRLEKVGNTVTAHMMYFEDVIPGTSLFAANNGAALSPWIYRTYEFTITDVNDGNVVDNFDLSQNYPNPFNPVTNIKYSIANNTNVKLAVYDMLGREVATLVNGAQNAGSYEVSLDASNLSSGIYVYTLTAGNFSSSKKLTLLK